MSEAAHIIREPSKSFARSVCCLKAEKRWAVTGTPIQNRLMDLFSLFKFLQCAPFDDLKVFNTHITQEWKSRSDPTSFMKLKTLVNCLSLRRPKTTIELPNRKDEEVELDFNEEERQYYQEVRISTLHQMSSANPESSGNKFFNTLKWVNELRLICNHGIMKNKTFPKLEDPCIERSPWNSQEAQTRFDQLDDVGLAKCSNAECCQDLSSALTSETDLEHEDEPFINESLEIWCSSCSERLGNHSKTFKICNHLPRKSKKNVVPHPKVAGVLQSCVGPNNLNAQGTFTSEIGINVPTKIKRVVQDLCDTPENIKRLVPKRPHRSTLATNCLQCCLLLLDKDV